MLAPIATVIFLATLWLVTKVFVELIDESGGRIAAALLRKPHRVEATIPPMRVRITRPQSAQPVRVKQQWRAAA